jgi:hypothetical protein
MESGGICGRLLTMMGESRGPYPVFAMIIDYGRVIVDSR